MEIKTLTVFTLVFATNNILSCFFSFFLIIDLQILAVITQLFAPTGIPTNEAKAETETHPVTVETKVS